MKKPLIVIAGPTACGKTAASIALAKKINGEIISADSMQVYKYMNIGTAKVTEAEMDGIKHYLVDELFPDEAYSVAVFQKLAKQYIDEIHKKDKTPILVGGTGFYINALIYNNDFSQMDIDFEYRNELEKVANENGSEYVHALLSDVDKEAAEAIHYHNVKRVIRALEYFKQTGQKISEHNKMEKMKTEYYDTKFFIFDMERQELYNRINLRVDNMIASGLVDEVRFLLDKGYNRNLTSMQGLGYKEIASYLFGECSLEEAIGILKRDTRHFAKRQLTWFKHQTSGIWLNVNGTSIVENLIKKGDIVL